MSRVVGPSRELAATAEGGGLDHPMSHSPSFGTLKYQAVTSNCSPVLAVRGFHVASLQVVNLHLKTSESECIFWRDVESMGSRHQGNKGTDILWMGIQVLDFVMSPASLTTQSRLRWGCGSELRPSPVFIPTRPCSFPHHHQFYRIYITSRTNTITAPPNQRTTRGQAALGGGQRVERQPKQAVGSIPPWRSKIL